MRLRAGTVCGPKGSACTRRRRRRREQQQQHQPPSPNGPGPTRFVQIGFASELLRLLERDATSPAAAAAAAGALRAFTNADDERSTGSKCFAHARALAKNDAAVDALLAALRRAGASEPEAAVAVMAALKQARGPWFIVAFPARRPSVLCFGLVFCFATQPHRLLPPKGLPVPVKLPFTGAARSSPQLPWPSLVLKAAALRSAPRCGRRFKSCW